MVDRALADMDFLARVQSSFEPEEMSRERIENWLTMAKSSSRNVKWGTRAGKQRVKEVPPTEIPADVKRKIGDLSGRLSNVKEVYEEIEKIDTISKVSDSVPSFTRTIQSSDVPTHKQELLRFLDEKSSSVVEEEVESGLLGDASEEILGRRITREEYSSYFRKSATSSQRSAGVRIANRMRSL